jgi:hypothetical protein
MKQFLAARLCAPRSRVLRRVLSSATPKQNSGVRSMRGRHGYGRRSAEQGQQRSRPIIKILASGCAPRFICWTPEFSRGQRGTRSSDCSLRFTPENGFRWRERIIYRYSTRWPYVRRLDYGPIVYENEQVDHLCSTSAEYPPSTKWS